jgi:hypothetical protein
LLSVYLVALWALTYFGNPFEWGEVFTQSLLSDVPLPWRKACYNGQTLEVDHDRER